MLTRADIRDKVKAFGGYGAKDEDFINAAIDSAERSLYTMGERWPWLQTRATITLTPGQAAEPVPSDMHLFERLVPVYGTNSPRVTYQPDSELLQTAYDPTADGPATGGPSVYTIRGDNFYFYPVPDRAYQYYVDYWYMPTPMALDTDTPAVPEGFEDVLVYGALQMMAARDQDQNMAAVWSTEYTGAVAGLKALDMKAQRQNATKVPMPGTYTGRWR